MPNPNLSEAIREAYAVANTDEVILHTLEIMHPSFVDEDGNNTPIRVVQNYRNVMLAIEDGTAVQFIGYPFEVTLPQVYERATPRLSITIDNVSRDILENVSRASETLQPITVTYRPYIMRDGDTTPPTPQYDPPLELVLVDVSANVATITASARFRDLGNRQFPNRIYTRREFPGLVR